MIDYTIWTTKDGKKIPIDKLTVEHIQNIIGMFERKGFISEKTLSLYLNAPVELMGDGAEMAFEMEFNSIVKKPVTRWIDILSDEIERRGKEVKIG